MSMEFKKPIEKLTRCPECRSRRLVVAMYGLKKDPLGGKPILECEGCYSVVRELRQKDVRALRGTPEGRAIINRELSIGRSAAE